MSVASLKKQLKALGLPQTGEKPALEQRLKLHALGEQHKIDGTNPICLKAGPLKKALATRGLPCDLSIEDKDALVGRLLEALRSENGGGEQGGAGGPSSSAADDITLAVAVAKQALDSPAPAACAPARPPGAAGLCRAVSRLLNLLNDSTGARAWRSGRLRGRPWPRWLGLGGPLATSAPLSNRRTPR